MRINAVMRGVGLLPAGALLGFVLAGPPAMAQQTWSGSSSPEDLLYRLDVLDAEIADIRARLGGLAAPEPSGAPVVAGGGDTAELEAEIRRLTATVEHLQNAQQHLVADLTRRLGDIEFRLNELEGNPTDGAIPPLDTGEPTGAATVTGPIVSVSERGDLDRAIADVKQGRFDQADERLRRFMIDFPGSPLLGEAWRWLGESQFVRGMQADAARSYLDGYNSNRTGPYAPHNLYRLGVTLGRLGQINEACLTLREVHTQFPAAPDDIAARADAEAEALHCG